MCIACWQELGTPTLAGPRITAAVELIRRVYEGDGCMAGVQRGDSWIEPAWRAGNAAGGNLHVILDDWNIDDNDFAPVFGPGACDWMTRTGPPHQLAIERACHDLLRSMTVEERASALARYDGYIDAPVVRFRPDAPRVPPLCSAHLRGRYAGVYIGQWR